MKAEGTSGSFISLLVCNLKLQHRQGFNAAWGVISVLYILGLYFIPENLKMKILPLILLSEPSTFAMIFTGAILLLERDEGLIENLFITPMSIREYMLSKALALSLPASISTVVIALALRGPSWTLLFIPPGVILTTIFFVLLTFIPASASKDIMGLLGRIGIYGSIFIFSILDYFGILAGYHQYLLPSKGTLDLMSIAIGTKDGSYLTVILSLISLCGGILIILPFSEKYFRKNLIESGGIA
jgi:fluoroquinolone transport system permease protein